jgi:HD superfamily phosphohydrolase
MRRQESQKKHMIFDPLYGFVKITPAEWEIIHSPFYQRLRWIKQLGFSFYVFPGAEHSRFGHSIGVMYNAHKILQSTGKGLPFRELINNKSNSKELTFHKTLRIAALLHDLGTFCFSHTTEMAYIRFGDTTNVKGGRGLKDDHENLGSFIIKNTDYEGGITHILKKYSIDPQEISDLVKGVSPNVLANQILHSEVDCDRMDYLLRDAHYTGLKYGSYDRDYLLYHFQVSTVDKQEILTIKENALHCVEDFLMSRFAWYSQVIRSPRGAKYDALAERVCFFLLKNKLIYQYSDLLEMVMNNPLRFFQFNDNYFINLVTNCYLEGKLDKNPDIKDMAYSLLFQRGPKVIRGEAFEQQILKQDNTDKNFKILKKAEDRVEELRSFLDKKGTSKDWIISDLPTRDIIFVKSKNSIIKSSTAPNILLERDPTKISFENGDVKLLAGMENSVIHQLQNSKNFLPNVFCSNSAYKLLENEGLVAPE